MVLPIAMGVAAISRFILTKGMQKAVKKFGQILEMMIKKDLRGTYNVSIGKKVYLNQIIKLVAFST